MSRHYRIGIIHYRVGRTDGVSLEIAKRKEILTSLGHEVHMIAGEFSNGHDYFIPKLEVDLPEIIEIKENAFSFYKKHSLTPEELIQQIDIISNEIKKSFLHYHQKNELDILLIHNIFAFGLHLPAAKAFAEIVDEENIPVIATNHDYYWERDEYTKVSDSTVQDFLDTYIPYKHPKITYVSINSLAQKELVRRRGIKSVVMGDTIDFDKPAWQVDDYNKDFLSDIGAKDNDLIILQATRIVRRKGIGLAIDVVEELTKRKEELVGQQLYNGKTITKDSDIVLVLPGFTELVDRPYRASLEEKISKTNIKALFINNLVGAKRKLNEHKKYSLWDCYAHADIITYPSLFEGWGNQFIEAVFAKKPIILFEYPVFKADIKKEGYFYISLGDQADKIDTNSLAQVNERIIQEVSQEAINTLTSKKTSLQLANNFAIGKQNHHSTILADFLARKINDLVAK